MLLFILLVLVQGDQECNLLDWSSEASLLKGLKTSTVSAECLSKALSHKYVEAASVIAKKGVEQDISFPESHKSEAVQMKQSLETTLSKIEGQGESKVVSPALQWAQSPSEVFIEVKFSHRLDSPGCLKLSDHEIDIQENKLHFVGHCVKANNKIKLQLDFELFGTIVPSESNYNMDTTGKIKFVLKKTEQSSWEKLNKGKKPGNFHVWWELKNKYEQAMSRFEDDEDEQDSSGIQDLINNPNVKIKDSYVDGKRIDNTDL